MSTNKRIFKMFKLLIKILTEALVTLFKTATFSFNELYKKLIKKLRFSITFKITTVYVFMFIRMLFFLSLVIFICFILYIGNTVENNIQRDYSIISSSIKYSMDIPKDNIDELTKLDNTAITIFSENKTIIYKTGQNNETSLFYDKGNNKNVYKINSNYLLITSNLNKSYCYLVLNNKTNWESNTIYIQVTYNLKSELFSTQILLIILLLISIFFILITIKSGSKASKKMLKPIETMTETVKNISVNALDTRLNVSGSQDELKELAETFNKMLDRIQLSYEQQNQFVSDASHELRTPISVIQGYANLLDRWGKEDKTVLDEAITAIKTEAESMKALVENLLFLARSDKNTQKIEKEYFDISDLISEIIKETKLIDKNHKILNTKIENINIYADRKMLKEAIRIFMDNSIKYTPIQGEITLNCFKDKNHTLVTIKDTGIGIPKDDLPKIFDRFYRADKSRTKETGGTGLGLSIAKWIILKHRGSIQVDSELNVGTTITLFLPI